MLRVSARWVIPVASPPLFEAAVLVGDDGRVAAVGPESDLPRPEGAEEWRLPDAVLLPGLVNTHSHLELTALRSLVRERPFPRWVGAVRRIKEALSAEQFRASARWGVLEGFAAGVTATGDTGSSRAPAAALAELQARGVAYQEVFGPDPGRADESVRALEADLEALGRYASDRVAIGVSPHAPYTVSAQLARRVGALALSRGLKVATHVAESPEEAAFVARGEGPFAEGLRRRGIAVAGQGCSPIEWLSRQGLLELSPLLIHCVTAGEEDFRRAAGCAAAVAHCPLSNAALGNGRADFLLMREVGVTVGVGTDSVAAGGGLDLFAEARAAGGGAALAPRETLRLVTADAARALGLAGAGFIAPGAWGDLTAVSLERAPLAGVADPEEAVALTATAADVQVTWVAGRLVYRRGSWPLVDQAAERAAYERACAAARAARAQGSSSA